VAKNKIEYPTDEELEEECFVDSENTNEQYLLLNLATSFPSVSNFFNTYDWTADFFDRTQNPMHYPITTIFADNLGVIENKNPPKDFWINEKTGIGINEIKKLEAQYKEFQKQYPFERENRKKSIYGRHLLKQQLPMFVMATILPQSFYVLL
jgi:hypothetical protein